MSSTEEDLEECASDDSISDCFKDVELQVLKESIQGKAKNTISAYVRAYTQLRRALDKEVHLASQELIIKTSEGLSQNLNTRAQLINQHGDYYAQTI